MATTSVAPITIPQINSSYYVGEAMVRTIQQAVTFAVANGPGTVIIPQEYAGTDSIAAVTGGNPNVFIVDERNAQRQAYYWNGTSYGTTGFVQMGGFVAEGMPPQQPSTIQLGYSPTGDLGNGSGNILVFADPGKPMPSLNLTLIPQDGSGLFTFLRSALDPAGNPRNQSTTLEVYSSPFFPNIFNMWIGQTPDVAGDKGMYIWARATENAIDFQGQTSGGAYDQTIRLNYLGGDVNIGMNASVTEEGAITAASANLDSLSAGDATFSECLVENSPVRTFSNTPDAPGPSYPPAGIGVSTGTSWSPTSINPATIAYVNAANIFTQPQTIQGFEIGQMAVSPTNEPSIRTTSAGHLILNSCHSQPTMLNWDGGGFTTVFGNGAAVQVASVSNVGDFMGNSLHAQGTATSASEIVPNSVWLDVLPGTGARLLTVGPSPGALAGIQFGGLDSLGANYLEYAHFAVDSSLHVSFTVDGDIVGNAFHVTGSSNLPNIPNSAWMDITGGNGRIVTVGPSAGLLTGFSIVGIDGAGVNYTEFMNVGSAGLGTTALFATSPNTSAGLVATGVFMTPNIGSGGNNSLYVGQSNTPGNAAEFGFTYLGNGSSANRGTIGVAGGATAVFDGAGNWTLAGNINAAQVQTGASGVVVGGVGPQFFWDGGSAFLEGAPNGRMLINLHAGVNSVCQVTGTFEVTGGPKTFRIAHPLDDGRDLVHACLEGPENGVYYRGEGETVNGVAEITLPDYFEKLTLPEGRTIALSERFGDADELEFGNFLAAGRIKDGKFNVRSNNGRAKFYWEVKAIRADIDPLEFAPKKEEWRDVRRQQTGAGTVGSGTAQAGEPKPKTVRAGNAVAAGFGRTRKTH